MKKDLSCKKNYFLLILKINFFSEMSNFKFLPLLKNSTHQLRYVFLVFFYLYPCFKKK